MPRRKAKLPAPRQIKLIATDRKLEAPFSARLRKQIDEQDMLTYKMSDRFRKGIPDIYVAGGIWIESKIVPNMPTRITQPMRYFSGPQKVEMGRLIEHGDQCFAALYFAFDGHNHAFALVPWWEFQRIALWDLDTINSLGTIINSRTSPDFHMERYFSKDHPLKFDPDIWWNKAFNDWVARNPEKFDENKVQGLPARVLASKRHPFDFYDSHEADAVEGEHEDDSADY